MKRTLFDDPSVCVTAHPVQKVVVHTSLLSVIEPEAWQASVQAGVDHIKRSSSCVWIADTSKAAVVLAPEQQAWLATSAIPEAVGGGLQAVITVAPASALGKLSNRKWEKETAKNGLIQLEVATLEEAFTVAADVVKKRAA